MIIPVERIVPSRASPSIAHDSAFFHQASASPAMTPSDAASVGVASPA